MKVTARAIQALAGLAPVPPSDASQVLYTVWLASEATATGLAAATVFSQAALTLRDSQAGTINTGGPCMASLLLLEEPVSLVSFRRAEDG